MPACKKKTEWGRCKQPALEDDTRCSAHRFWEDAGVTPDRYYHEKIAKGLTTPTWDWMTDAEGNAVINGRYRGDGRRIDQYIGAMEPMRLDVEAFG